MALNKALFSSDKEDWATPQDFFDSLNEEFHFNLDPCADPENAKCDRFFTKEENGLFDNMKYGQGFRIFSDLSEVGSDQSFSQHGTRFKMSFQTGDHSFLACGALSETHFQIWERLSRTRSAAR